MLNFDAFLDELGGIIADKDIHMSSDRVMAKMAAPAWLAPTARNIAIGAAIGGGAGAATTDKEMGQSRGKRAAKGALIGGALGGLGGNAAARVNRRIKGFQKAIKFYGIPAHKLHKKSPMIREAVLERAAEYSRKMPLYG